MHVSMCPYVHAQYLVCVEGGGSQQPEGEQQPEGGESLQLSEKSQQGERH